MDSGPSFTNRPLLLLEKGERVCFCMGREGWGEKRRGRGEEKEEAGRERGGHTLHLTHTTYHTTHFTYTHTHTSALSLLGSCFPPFFLTCSGASEVTRACVHQAQCRLERFRTSGLQKQVSSECVVFMTADTRSFFFVPFVQMNLTSVGLEQRREKEAANPVDHHCPI